MKLRAILIILFATICLPACKKNTASKIPNIAYISSSDVIRVNVDDAYILFSIKDGDADLGNDTISAIFWKDSRFDSAGFIKTEFPKIDDGVEDPKKGLEAECTFFPVPQPTPRFDSLHTVLGDTLTYELYVIDRAGHTSNHITTKPLYVLPK